MDGYKLLREIEMPVRWGDMDALGHVNNTVYFRYFEQVRVAWMEAQNAPVATTGEGIVIATTACSFRQAIRYPATLRVRMFGGPPRRSSFETRYEIIDAADLHRLYASGSARVVWVDHGRGVSSPLPDSIRRLLPEGLSSSTP